MGFGVASIRMVVVNALNEEGKLKGEHGRRQREGWQ